MRKQNILSGLAGIVLSAGISSNSSGFSVEPKTVDPGLVYSNPSLVVQPSPNIDRQLLTWSRGDSLVLAASDSDFKGVYVIDNTKTQYSNITSLADRFGGLHIAFNAIDNGISQTYFVGSRSALSDVRPLGIGNVLGNISMDFASSRTADVPQVIYIAGQRQSDIEGEGSNIVLMKTPNAYTTDFSEEIEFHLPGDQIDPSIAIDSHGTVHLAYTDKNEGTDKVKYINSLDDYFYIENISPANQSYQPLLKLDDLENPFISYKSDQNGFVAGQELTSGNIYLAKKTDSGFASTKITDDIITYPVDRQVDLQIDRTGGINLSWAELNQLVDPTISLMYAHKYPEEDSFTKNVIDTGINPNLGYPSLGLLSNSDILLSATTHSLDNYNIQIDPFSPPLEPPLNPLVPEPYSLGSVGLATLGAFLAYRLASRK